MQGGLQQKFSMQDVYLRHSDMQVSSSWHYPTMHVNKIMIAPRCLPIESFHSSMTIR